MISKHVFKKQKEDIINELTTKILDRFNPLPLDKIITSDLPSLLESFSYHYLIFNKELESFVNSEYNFDFSKNHFFINKIFNIPYRRLKLLNSESIVYLHMKVFNEMPNNTFELSISTISPIMESLFNAEHLNFKQETAPYIRLKLPLNYKFENELPLQHLIQEYLQEHMQVIYDNYNEKITYNIQKLKTLTEIFALLKENNINLSEFFLSNKKYSLSEILSIIKNDNFLTIYDSLYLKTDRDLTTFINTIIE